MIDPTALGADHDNSVEVTGPIVERIVSHTAKQWVGSTNLVRILKRQLRRKKAKDTEDVAKKQHSVIGFLRQ